MQRLLLTVLFAVLFSNPMNARADRLFRESKDIPELASIEQPQLEATSSNVKNLRVSVGHGEFLLQQGSAARIQRDGKAVGIYFKGEGVFKYRTDDKVEFPRSKYNAAKVGGVRWAEPDQAMELTTPFQEALIWFQDQPLPSLEGATGADLNVFYPAALRWADDVDGPCRTHLQYSHQVQGGLAPLVIASLKGSRSFLYVFDPAQSQVEALWCVQKRTAMDPHGADLALLSQQPIGWNQKVPVAPDFLLSAVEMDLTGWRNDKARLMVTETLVPVSRSLSCLTMSLLNDRFAGSLDDRRELVLRSVKDEQGRDVGFSHRQGEVLIRLNQSAEARKPFKLTFEIEGDFLVRPGGDNYWELGTSPWFPQPDLNGQAYSIKARIRTQKPFVPMACGRTARRFEEDGFNGVEVRIDEPIQFFVVLAGKYSMQEETKDGLTIRVATYAFAPRDAPKLFTLTRNIINYYQSFLGPFPFKEFNIIEKNSWGYGQAPPGVMLITKEAFNPIADEINRYFSRGINERFAHEIAHQYWGHVVKMPSIEEQWLTESFSEYSAALFLRYVKRVSEFDLLVQNWRTHAEAATAASAIPTANDLWNGSNNWERFRFRTGLIYDKGAYLLYCLNQELGDKVFLTFLKSYQATFRWKFGTTEHLNGLLKHITGKDHAAFFDRYYWGSELPPKPGTVPGKP
ncbi:MAG: hypothetical protein IPP78_08790 [Holophagaceae bacterium]|nr:hypothetical protein [Holophagaceae bacterium]